MNTLTPLAIPVGYRAEAVREDGINYISVCRWEARSAAWRMVFSVRVEPGEGIEAARQRAVAIIKS